VVELIEQEKQAGAIVIVVTHEATFASAVADRVLQMHRGRIVESEA
jgi:ABC-type polar amino acid transport system ATPase subunit